MDSSMYIIIAIIFVVMLGGGFVFSRIQAKKMTDQMADLIDFEKEHPNASVIYYQMKSGLKDCAIHVHKIDGVDYLSNQDVQSTGQNMKDIYTIKHGDNFQQIISGNNLGFYILPGTVCLNVSYITSRKGVIYDSITKYTDAQDVVVEVEPNTSYFISFDEKKKEFTFTEVE